MKLKLSALTLAMLPALSYAGVHVKAADKPYMDDSVLVVFKKDASADDRRQVRQLLGAKISGLSANEIDTKYKHVLGGRLSKMELSSVKASDALKKLNNHPAIEYAEPNYILKADATPDDTDFSSLWGLHNTGQSGGTADADIDAVEAWDITTGSNEVIIGVIDTGVDYTHPDLAANMWVNPGEIAGDGIDNDGNGVVDDVHGFSAYNDNGDPMDGQGHGTHVAGTIGAKGNNALGVVGVNWDVSIIGCQFLSPSGTGSTADAIECIDYMTNLKVNHGVDIKATNNSWGGGGFSQALVDSIDAAGDAGILFIAAAGNDGDDTDVTPHYPSSYESDVIMSIASTDRNDDLSIFSVGASSYGLESVDMGAPGSAILSTTPGNTYSTYSGTSMATPHVAGAAALVWSINPELSPLEMKELLMNSGDAIASLDGKTVSGNRLNVERAIQDADPEPGFKLSVSPSNVELTAGETATYTFSLGSIADWSGEVALALDSGLAGATLSAATAQPGEEFTLTVPTSADTQWGDYSFTVTGTSGELVKEKSVTLSVLPQGLRDITYPGGEGGDIPDNNTSGISSTMTVTDDVTIFGSSTYVNITHTWIGDLTVTLTSPAGTVATLHAGAGGSADDIDQSFASDKFDGENAAGDWTLTVVDAASADTGTLNNWNLTLTVLGDSTPVPPQAEFSFEADGLSVAFTDASTDSNGDLASWSWDFGDGNASSEQSPVHTYAEAGTYNVTLTATDEAGQSHSITKEVTVSDSVVSAEITRAYKSRLGRIIVDISFDGASGEQVEIYRNGEKVATTDNDGSYRDRVRRYDGDSATYQVCEVDGNCSAELTAQF